MNKVRMVGMILGVLGFLALTDGFRAQDEKPKGEKHDGTLLRDSLKEVINVGADLFNKYGDHAGCYRIYQGALISIKPFLPPETQKEIETSLVEAEKQARFSDRAKELRKTLDNIRAQAVPANKVEEKSNFEK
jgi:hypothetical protein